jgi:DUF971 family protein
MILISNLRKHCPCANCLINRQNKPSTYIPLYSEPQLRIREIKPVGNYAIQIVWDDGHDSGIYSYDKLYENKY